MTVEEMKQGMREVLGVTDPNAPFTQFWGSHRSIRQGIEDKASDALVEIFEPNPPAGSRAAIFQARFKDMVYSLVNDTSFLNNAKWITGEELPVGYNAHTLHQAYVELLDGGNGVPPEPED